MSRFYDALKEASRSQEKSNGTPSEGEPNVEPAGKASSVEAPIQYPEVDADPQTEMRERKPNFLPLELLEEAAVKANGSIPLLEPHPEALKNTSVENPPSHSPKEKIQISFDPTARLITQAADTVVVEHYRKLRTKILQQHANRPFKSLMVTSPGPEEGKTVTILNLALSFAMLADFKVLVVDGDLRRGTIGKLLGVDDHPGLSNMMEGRASLAEVALQCRDVRLHFVLRGNSALPAAELLHSTNHLSSVFDQMTKDFDLVLVDSPPVNLITDAQLLAQNCDAVLLVARAFSTTRKSLEQAVRDLQDARIIGTILNGGTRAQLYRRYHGYY
jgi:capsular exopolysaccharide synthesis family protein